MHVRRFSLIAALALTATLLSGCGGEPQPVETTAPFASEDEAFAAAEATYRAYVDASNARLGSESSQVDPTAFLMGLALEGELDSSRELVASSLKIAGEFRVDRVSMRKFDSEAKSVVMGACLDISGTTVIDANDEDVTPTDRLPVVPLEIVVQGSGRTPLISEINSDPIGEPC